MAGKGGKQPKIICKDCLAGKCKIHSEPPAQHRRPSWDEYFMSIAETTATRSTCLRHRVGAILVSDRRILSTGYNGAPRGMVHCLEIGCLRDKLKIPSGKNHELCRAVHAEQNVVIQAARHGISTVGSDLYTTLLPCAVCNKILVNAGVKRIVYQTDYPDEFAKKILKEAKVKLVRFNSPARKE